MSTADAARTRLRASLDPRLVLRSGLSALLPLAAAPLLVALLLLVTGSSLPRTGGGALFVQGLAVNLLLGMVVGATVLFGVLTSMALHRSAHVGMRPRVRSAWSEAARALPGLSVVLVALGVGLVVATLAWAPISVALLLAAAVLQVRARRSAAPDARARRLAVLGVPFVPIVAVLALLLSALPAALSGAGGPVGVLRSAVERLRTGKRGLATALPVVVVVSSAITLTGSALASTAQAAAGGAQQISGALASTLTLTFFLALFMAAVGATFAVLTPPAGAPSPRSPRSARSAPRVRSGLRPGLERLRPSPRVPAGIASVVVAALVLALTPATAQAAEVPVAEAAAPTNALVLEASTTEGDVPGSLVFRATVNGQSSVAEGTVQFVLDGVDHGAPVPLSVVDAASFFSDALLEAAPTPTSGAHTLSFTYLPADPAAAPVDAAPIDFFIKHGVTVTATAPPGTRVDEPASIDVTVTALPEQTGQVPTGQVRLTAWWEEATLDLVDGAAHWDIASLPQQTITVEYLGDDTFAPSTVEIEVGGPSVVVPVDPPPTPPFVGTVYATQISGVVTDLPTPLGQDVYGDITVTAPDAPVGTVPAGGVDVYLGTRLLTSGYLWDGATPLFIPTGSLTVGSHELRVVYVPEDGFGPSEMLVTVELTAGRTDIWIDSIVPADRTLTWGEEHVVTATVESAPDGPRTLEVYDAAPGGALLASVPFEVVGGTALVRADLTRLLPPSVRAYSLRVPEGVSWEAGYADSRDIRISRAASTLSVTAPPAVVGIAGTISAAASSPAGPVTGLVTFRVDGIVIGAAPMVEGAAALAYTPVRAGEYGVTAELTSTTFAPASATASFVAVGAQTPEPVAAWSGDLTPDSTRLTVTYPALGATVPTGTLEILTADGDVVASGPLDAGRFTSLVMLAGGSHELSVRYSGDPVFAPRTDALPPVTVTGYHPVVTVVAPSTVLAESSFDVDVQVTSIPLRLVDQVAVEVTAADGTVTTEPVQLDAMGTGTLRQTHEVAGSYTYTATVSYVAAAALEPTTSATQVVQVSARPVPVLTLSLVTPEDEYYPGRYVDLAVETPGSATALGMPAGTRVELYDGDRLIASGTLVAEGDVLRAELRVFDFEPGVHLLTATASYAGGRNASSQVLAVDLPAPNGSLFVTAPDVVVGGIVVADLFATIDRAVLPESLPVEVTFGGRRQYVVLARPAWSRQFTGTAAFVADEPGGFVVRAAYAGDPRLVRPLTDDDEVRVARHPVTLLVGAPPSNVMSGAPAVVSGSLLGFYGAPTGTITYRLDPSGLECESGPSGHCELPERAVHAGMNTLVASYSGDTYNQPVSVTTTFTALARQGHLSVRYTPAPAEWVAGGEVTASWTVSADPLTAEGTVVVRAGDARCSGPAAAGECTFTVPQSQTYPEIAPLGYSATYLPTDDSLGDSLSGTVRPEFCARLTVLGAHELDLSAATTCHLAGGEDGVLTGSTVVVTAKPGTSYAVSQWHVDGDVRAGSGRYSLAVTRHHTLSYDTRWSPECFTLTLTPHGGAAPNGQDGTQGQLVPLTAPNCTDPRTPSWDDKQDALNGVPRYAAGTEVHVRATYAYRGSVERELPPIALAGFTGATPLRDNPDVATVVMDEDKTVSATFKLRDCTVVELAPSEGGAIQVVSAQRPRLPQNILPASGACTTGDGRTGYVPGTTVTLRAVPDATSYFLRYESPGVGQYVDDQETGQMVWKPFTTMPVTVSGAVPTTTESPERTMVVPAADHPVKLAGVFGVVDCVEVRTVLTYPVGYSDPDVVYPGTDLTACEGRSSTRKVTQARYAKVVERTDWVVKDRWLFPQLKDSNHVVLQYFGYWLGKGQATWSLSDPSVRPTSFMGHPPYGGRVGDSSGPQVDLRKVDGSITVSVQWPAASCAGMYFDLPTGGSASAREVAFWEQQGLDWKLIEPSPVCGRPNHFPTGAHVVITPEPRPGLTPFFSVPTRLAGHNFDEYFWPAHDGRSYSAVPDTGLPMELWGAAQHQMRLEYCVRLDLRVEVVGDSAAATPLDPSQYPLLLADNGGCPPGWSRPDREAKVGLTQVGAYSYTMVGPQPLIAVGGTGTTAPTTIRLKAICFTVDTDDANLRTAGNCPGGAGNRFTKGTVVEVAADMGGGDKFRGWSGIDTAYGTTAYVIVDTDRSVVADIDEPEWYEKVGNAFSSFAQRLVSVGTTIITGLVMAEMYVIQAASLAMTGVSALLHAVGVEGKVLDGFDKGIDIVDGQIAMMGMMADCTGSWARGSTITALPSIPTGSNERAADFLGDGSEMTIGELTDLSQDQLEKLMERNNDADAAEAMGIIGNIRDLVDGFASNPDMYTQDARTAWSNMGSEIGSCVERGVEENLSPILGR